MSTNKPEEQTVEGNESTPNEDGSEIENDYIAENEELANIIRDLAVIDINIEDAVSLRELGEVQPINSQITKYETARVPDHLSVISWNIDMQIVKIGERTKTIIDLLEKEKHDIILLQEVRKFIFNYICNRLKQTHIILRQENKFGYFTATLLRKETVKYESHKIIYFKNTSQGRSILLTKACVGGAKLDIMNVHLESTGSKEISQRRIAQFERCLTIASSTPSDRNVLIGGDMNIREWETKKVPMPKKICDLWVQQGSNSSQQWTWDLTVNKNLEMLEIPPPKRFDRFYLRTSTPDTLRPEYFGLAGKKKLPDSELYPSDHWAIVSKFFVTAPFEEYVSSSERGSSLSEEREEGEGNDRTGKSQDNHVVKENWYDDD